jgi:hypothetical protein
MIGMKGANFGLLKMMLAKATIDGSVTTVLTPPNTKPLVSHAAAYHVTHFFLHHSVFFFCFCVPQFD